MSSNSEANQLFQRDIIQTLERLPPFLKVITETDLFLRLKKINQLGLCLVFPKVDHSRFDHSIGTCHLAKELMDILQKNGKIEIPQLYRECVQIAALLHDIGHGPWSHFWEQNINKNDKHERNCEICIDKIFEKSSEVLKKQSDVFNKNRKFAVQFVKSLIIGKQVDLSEHQDLQNFQFLYEIVNNKHEDIDVDRWDYLKRDYYNAEKYVDYPEFQKDSINLNFEDIFTNAAISKNGKHIEYDKKSIQIFINARQNLHVQLYTHPTTKLYEHLLARALKRADEKKLMLTKFNGKLMSEVNFRDKFNIGEIIHLNDEYIFDELKKLKDDEIKKLIDYIENAKSNTVLREKITKVIKLNVKDCALIEIKVKSPYEKMKKSNLETENMKNETGIHQLHVYNVQKLLEHGLPDDKQQQGKKES